MGSAVNKDERIAITANSNTVSKHDVHVNSVKVIVFCTIKEATSFGLSNCCIRAKGEGKLAAINPLSILADLQKMFVISELVSSSADQWVFVSEVLAVFQGQTKGKEVPG